MRRRHLLILIAASLLCLVPRAAEAAPIHRSGFVKIGGIDQWIDVNGEDNANPIILVVHGGPGEAQSRRLRSRLSTSSTSKPQ